MPAAEDLTVWLKRFQWPRGLRAAIAVGGALLLAHSLHLPPAATALGAFNPLLVDNGGPYRPRLVTMTTTMLGGGIAFIIGALIPANLGIIILATMLVAFTVTFARVLAQPIASSAVLILVLYFAGLGGTLHTFHGAAMAAGLVLLGGVWATFLSLFLWTIDPFRPARLAVASCYLGLAQFTAEIDHAGPEAREAATQIDPGFEWRRQQRIRIEAARTALSATAARAPARTVRAHNLTVLLETSDMLLARTMRLSELRAAAIRARMPASTALADDLTHWLARAEAAVAEALFTRPDDNAASFAREGSLRLELIGRRHDLLDSRLPQTETLHRHLLVEERDALLELEIIFDAMRALWTGVETPATQFLGALAGESRPGWRDSLSANWTLDSAAMRHALRLTVVSATDVVVMHLIHVNHGFWLPMTSIILMQPFSAGTVRKSLQRVTGTVVGGILAAILAVLVSTPLAMLAIVTVLSALTVATFAVDYAIYCLFLTPTFVLLSLPSAHDWRYAFIRIGTTLAGALIAVSAMRLLWPERAEVELGHLMRRGAGAAGAYLEAMLAFWQVPAAGRQQAERTLLAPARRACGLASNDAEEAVDRVMQEPSLGRRADAETTLRKESLTFVTYLRRLTQSVTTLALVGADSVENRTRLAPIAARLDRLAHQASTIPRPVTDSETATRIDIAEEQMQRIERQTTVLERTAAALWQVAPDLQPLATPEQEQREAADNQRSRQPQP